MHQSPLPTTFIRGSGQGDLGYLCSVALNITVSSITLAGKHHLFTSFSSRYCFFLSIFIYGETVPWHTIESTVDCCGPIKHDRAGNSNQSENIPGISISTWHQPQIQGWRKHHCFSLTGICRQDFFFIFCSLLIAPAYIGGYHTVNFHFDLNRSQKQSVVMGHMAI